MTTGVSVFLIALGAILTFAVTETVNGINLISVGWVLMIVGGLGLVLSLLFWSSFSPYRRDRTIVEDHSRGPLV